MNYNFEWDPNKAKSNILKHKISFEDAASVFKDENAISIYDDKHSTQEDNISRGLIMEAEYDFSKGERGKFYKKDAQFHLPIYLEPEVESFFTKLAKKQKTDLTQIVNNLLYKDKELIELATAKV